MCNSMCTGAKYSVCRCGCHGANHGTRRKGSGRPTPTNGPVAVPEESPRGLDAAVRKIGLSILRGAAVGVACGAMPAMCPAILAINQAAGLAQVASDIYQAYSTAVGPGEGVARAAKKGGQAAVSMSITEAIQDHTEAQMRGVAGAVGMAIGAGASGAFGADPAMVRAIAEETTYRAMEEGIDGVVSWTVEEVEGSS